MLIRAFEIEVGRPFEIGALLKHECVRRAGIEPDIENVGDLLPIVGILHQAFEEALLGARLEPGVGAFRLEGRDDSLDQRAGAGEA